MQLRPMSALPKGENEAHEAQGGGRSGHESACPTAGPVSALESFSHKPTARGTRRAGALLQ